MTFAELKVSTLPRTPLVLIEDPLEAPGQREYAVTHDGDRQGVDQIAVEQIEFAALALDFGQDVFLGEFWIGSAAEEELLEALHVEDGSRHAEDDRRRLPGSGAHRTGVADGAIDEDAVDALVAPL
jgi:hypothetical protein